MVSQLLAAGSEAQVDGEVKKHKHFFSECFLTSHWSPTLFVFQPVPLLAAVKWFYKYCFQYSGTIPAVLLTISN